ncbi:MAG TPA: signal recognition particle-docking protein FtsY [Candidatus Faecivicinus avistercoris]|nr:signal recognition particle-docking protein FtsY [Candidatus Faecivicinus avistercoris]
MGLFDRIKAGMKRTREAFSGRMDELVENYKELDDEFYEDLTDILIMADVGMATTELAVGRLREKCTSEKIGDPAKAREALKEILTDILRAEPMQLTSPMVLLIIGVNGVGKTTSIGKLASRMKVMGRRVVICAGDTFRAAAAEQLTIWAERADVPIVKQHEGADPAAVVYDGIQAAKGRHADVLIVDTAGRLHNKSHLMEELRKISRVVEREYPEAALSALLVIDATTGQNGLAQAKVFGEVANLDGIILTKLDGTAKGGIAIAIRNELGLPVRYIGLGEKLDDMQPFDARAFVDALFG